MAKAFGVEVELLDDAVFSARPATAGAHAGLDCVPGSALLGCAAAALYPRLSMREAWLLFHSGKVRFGNGVPLAPNGQPAWPVPLCLHAPKGAAWREDGRLVAARIRNLARGKRPEGEQWQQLREVRITADGLVHTPARELAMKTAIDPETGRAAESQLYGYEALRAGQRFVAVIEADDDVPDALFARLRECLADTIVHLGRSRGAQYGRARVSLCDALIFPEEDPAPSTKLVLWLLSDAMLVRDAVPIFAPSPKDFGLPGGELLHAHSFVRARSYAPYNAHRRSYDAERQVIAAGSVLVFSFDEPIDPQTIPRSFGLWREAGLGRVAVNPKLLADERPVLAPACAAEEEKAPARPASALLDWLEAQQRRAERTEDVQKKAEAWAQELLEHLYKNAKRLAGEGAPLPGKTQWGRVRELAMAVADGDALVQALFGAGGPIKEENNPDWTAKTMDEQGKLTTIRAWLYARFTEAPKHLRAELAVQLARRMTDALARREAEGRR